MHTLFGITLILYKLKLSADKGKSSSPSSSPPSFPLEKCQPLLKGKCDSSSHLEFQFLIPPPEKQSFLSLWIFGPRQGGTDILNVIAQYKLIHNIDNQTTLVYHVI